MTISSEISYTPRPDRIIAKVDNADVSFNESMANEAVRIARSRTPKITGHTAGQLQPVFGDDYFGIYFPTPIAWFLEKGVNPFTMKNLEGKTIPMWIDDPTGKERAANPKAKRRTTMDGRMQILIFRKVAKRGARKTVERRINGKLVTMTVPASYPGAPGRIGKRQASHPYTTAGKVGGAIAARNVGVRWRHPGISGRDTMNSAITEVLIDYGFDSMALHLVDSGTFYNIERI